MDYEDYHFSGAGYDDARAEEAAEAETVTWTTQPCAVCGERSEFTLDAKRVREWMNGGLIQNVFPELTATEREQLISGTHGPCWDVLWGGQVDD